MGVLNLTEDSFSDGALYMETHQGVKHACAMIEQGASIIDIGAESTRPGSKPVPKEIEMQRVIPVLTELKQVSPSTLYSIDTRKASVAKAALERGADIINDISALRDDAEMSSIIASFPQARVILMHMQGQPQNMQNNPTYEDVLRDIYAFFSERIDFCLKKGIKISNIMLDPGIGFGKNLQHNLKLLANLNVFHKLGLPIVLGASRKSFIDAVSPTPVEQRLAGSLAAAAWGTMQNVAVIRCHDVWAHVNFLRVFQAIDCERNNGTALEG
ncbi:MAG: dihydropteroate synthase [Candidatus Cloacimonetes bacterium HGW-Cloacimonetes-3]|jgi:dihydropteroate synthase|nr:MAG: dihydropteroate synthase [Candidatus Cloacimonetes bacterium HGW-Cloacimonetes-3]